MARPRANSLTAGTKISDITVAPTNTAKYNTAMVTSPDYAKPFDRPARQLTQNIVESDEADCRFGHK
jgi:hypothetical protein